MKIGLVCPYDMFRPGGVQSCIMAYYHELTARGHAVKIITPTPQTIPEEYNKDIIFVAQSRELNTPFHTMVDIALRVDEEELNSMLSREDFDILHFHEPWVPRMPMELLSQSKTLNIATFHAKLPESLINKSIEKVIAPYTKQVFKKLHHMAAVSDAAASYVRSLTNGTPIEIVPNGINLSVYNPDKVEKIEKYNDDVQTIVYVGRLEKRKGTIWLLKAYEKLIQTHSKVRLVIAGDGHKRQMLEEYVEANELPNVEFLGFVSDEHKLQLLKTADLYCSPAIYGESFGIVLLEAMAMGAVTVCGNNPGYSSVMTGRGRLSLIDPKNTDLFAKRLELLLQDEEIRNLWKEWAKSHIPQFNYPRVVDSYEEIYKTLQSNRQENLKNTIEQAINSHPI